MKTKPLPPTSDLPPLPDMLPPEAHIRNSNPEKDPIAKACRNIMLLTIAKVILIVTSQILHPTPNNASPPPEPTAASTSAATSDTASSEKIGH